jgi:hypothetical protein
MCVLGEHKKERSLLAALLFIVLSDPLYSSEEKVSKNSFTN